MRPTCRRSIAAYLLANYVFLLVGIPLPLPVEQDVSCPFPCQHHGCGCHSADQCWRQCCCFTHAEKLAWARANHVDPPAELLAQAPESPVETQSCCAELHDHEVPLAGAATSCGGDRTCSAPHEQQSPATDEPTPPVERVNGIRALGCQGGSSLWMVLATSTVPEDPVAFEADRTSRPLTPAIDGIPLCVARTPEPPPPRA
ncbi:MAG: hypothetical protein WD845_11045 [Pirellulales bacterium]